MTTSQSSSEERAICEDDLRLSRVPAPARSFVRAGCGLVAFCIPLKLALTYIALAPLIVLWGLMQWKRPTRLLLTKQESSVLAPLAFLIVAITFGAIVGIDPIRSASPLLSLTFFSLTIFVFRDFSSPYYALLALITGQTIASIHSVIAAAWPGKIPSLFLGSVTESGQLSLSLLVCVGLLWSKYSRGKSALPPSIPRIAAISFATTLLLLCALGFYSTANISGVTLFVAWAIGIALIRILLKNAPRALPEARGILTIATFHLPLLLCALLVNLKRGPWVGVVVGLAVFCAVYARRLLAVIIVGAIVTSVSVPPIRERLAASYEHFTISGGRSTIWHIGIELAAKYPLGVGYHNSGVLRQFSLEIPPELKHFHNNLINIAAENGILTACIFVWFIYSLVRVCFARPLSALHVAIGCAFISWQTAGLVEYNFGDSEVMLIVWVLLGCVLADLREREISQGHSTQVSNLASG